jgi:hypothetical protein
MKRNKEIDRNNMLIAYFMSCLLTKENYVTTKGTKHMFPDKTNTTKHINDLRYNLSWDWLMPVCLKAKIVLLEFKKVETDEEQEKFKQVIDLVSNIKAKTMSFEIEPVYEAVIEFINWYNSENNGPLS